LINKLQTLGVGLGKYSIRNSNTIKLKAQLSLSQVKVEYN